MDLMQPKRKEMYKSRMGPDVTKKGQKILQENRKSNRNNLLMNKRKIDPSEINVSGGGAGADSKQVLLDKLKAWKEQKKRERLEKKAREKPIFKVHHVSADIGLPKLENVNRTIKGKVFNAEPKTKKTEQFTLSQSVLSRQNPFVFGFTMTTSERRGPETKGKPSDKHAVQTPDGGIASRLRSRTKSALNPTKTPGNKKNNKMQTNAKKPVKKMKSEIQKVRSKNEANTLSRRTGKENADDPEVNKTPRKRRQSNEDEPEYSSPKKKMCPQSPDVTNSDNKTPSRTPLQQQLANSYVSPYVTISRGKSSARKEFQLRSSQGGLFDVSPQFAKVTGPQAGAAHFHRVLDDEIERIEKMCADWLEYKDNENQPEEACDMINTAVGQSNLLLSKKFKQFRSLIHDCEGCNAQRTVTCSDLHGFWEMTYLQVENVNKRFENLENLRNNDWKEILPETEEPKKPREKKKVIKKSKKTKVQSSLKELIKAQRQRAKEQISDAGKAFSPTCLELPTVPLKSPAVNRNSLLASIVISERKKRNSSPGLAMIRAAKLGRCTANTTLAESTPGRSILKTPRSKSVSKKSVLFKTRRSSGCRELLENTTPPTIDTTFEFASPTPTTKPLRRSSRRLSRTTLQFDN